MMLAEFQFSHVVIGFLIGFTVMMLARSRRR